MSTCMYRVRWISNNIWPLHCWAGVYICTMLSCTKSYRYKGCQLWETRYLFSIVCANNLMEKHGRLSNVVNVMKGFFTNTNCETSGSLIYNYLPIHCLIFIQTQIEPSLERNCYKLQVFAGRLGLYFTNLKYHKLFV